MNIRQIGQGQKENIGQRQIVIILIRKNYGQKK